MVSYIRCFKLQFHHSNDHNYFQVRGKRCGTAPSEDNDTLFLGNICNTWTKEAVYLLSVITYKASLLYHGGGCKFSIFPS